MHVPRDCIGWVAGNRGSSLRQVEEDTETYCFIASVRGSEEELLIFSFSADARNRAERIINQLVTEKLSRGRSRSRSRSRSYDRRRRSPSYGDRCEIARFSH